jgi:hypothetical protein
MIGWVLVACMFVGNCATFNNYHHVADGGTRVSANDQPYVWSSEEECEKEGRALVRAMLDYPFHADPTFAPSFSCKPNPTS